MTTEAQARKQYGLPLVLSTIISAARRRAGVSALSDSALAEEVVDWQRILAPIPGNRIEECELRAVRQRSVKALLQPQELLAMWAEIRDEERARQPATFPASLDASSCPYCEGHGWQIYATLSESGNENTAARACCCDKAPIEARKLEPLHAPEYRKRKHSMIWEKVEQVEDGLD
jgi:hypothetical protein